MQKTAGLQQETQAAKAAACFCAGERSKKQVGGWQANQAGLAEGHGGCIMMCSHRYKSEHICGQ